MTPEKLYEALSRYAASRGVELNADRDYVMDILAGLLKNEERYGYRSCPCRLAMGDREKDRDIVCPCYYSMPDIGGYGSCYCGLYVSKEWNEGKVARVKVPERRPPELR
jgi:ferredoxin-thioredoxin reductase catalytic subunit